MTAWGCPAVLEPAGYVGSPLVDCTVTGGPFGTNFFRVEGPNVGGPGVDNIETDLFSVSGKIFTPPAAPTPTPTPTPTPDSDGDGVPDSADNCPAWPNPLQTLPPWPVPAGDPDCDGFTTTEENFVGTDPLDSCANTSVANDEADDRWPADFDDNQVINILDITQLLPPVFGSAQPGPDYSTRKDLNGDGFINILDVSRMLPPVFDTNCG